MSGCRAWLSRCYEFCSTPPEGGEGADAGSAGRVGTLAPAFREVSKSGSLKAVQVMAGNGWAGVGARPHFAASTTPAALACAALPPLDFARSDPANADHDRRGD